MMKPIYITSEEASIIMVMLNETDILLEKAKRLCYPLTEDQLLKIADKARKVCWDFHCDQQEQRGKNEKDQIREGS